MSDIKHMSTIDTFYLRARVDNLSDKTLKNYRYVLDSAERFLNGIPLDKATTTDLRRHFFDMKERGLSDATLATHQRYLASFYRFLEREKLLDSSPMANIGRIRLPAQFPRCLEPHEVKTLLTQTIGRDFKAIRNRTMVLMFYDTGIRLGELVGLDMSDVNMTSATLRVIGKGRRERVVPMGEKMLKQLFKYVAARGDIPYETALFISKRKLRLRSESVTHIVSRLGKQAGLKKCHPHMLRHACATSLIRAGMDVFTAQKMLGHQQISTLAIYTHMTALDVKREHSARSPVDRLC
jgi:site-specific recombinase XerD